MKYLLAILFLSFATAVAEEHLSPADQKVVELMGHSSKSDLSIIGSDRAAVVDRLRQLATKKITHVGTASLGDDDAQIVLIRMGDEQTIQEVIVQYQKYNSGYVLGHIPDMLEWARQPMVIPYLASDFYLDEDPQQSVNLKQGWEAVGAPARSVYSGVIAVRVIQRVPAFSEEMKAWAKDAYALRLKDAAKFRRLMQAWWTENKDAFSKKDYASVHPIDIATFEATSESPALPAPPQSPKPEVKPPEAVTPTPEQSSTPILVDQVQAVKNTNIPLWLYSVLILSLAAIATAWFFFLREKK